MNVRDLRKTIRTIINEVKIERALENALENIIDEPEYMTPEAYIDWIESNEWDRTFDTLTLQAIARNVSGTPAPGQEIVRSVKQKLLSAGFVFTPRDIERRFRSDKHSRGELRYDKFNHAAGSGLFGGLPGIGRGQGAIGGSKAYTGDEPGALPMGSRKR